MVDRALLKQSLKYGLTPGLKNPDQKLVLVMHLAIAGSLALCSLASLAMGRGLAGLSSGACLAGIPAVLEVLNIAMDYQARCTQKENNQKVTGISSGNRAPQLTA